MRAEAERHYRVAGVGDARLQSQSITYFVVYFERERPRPDRIEIRIVRRFENRRNEIRPATCHAKGALTCEAMNRVAMPGIVHRQPIFASIESEASAADAARPWKENRNAAAMRMLAPCVGIGRARDDVERPGAIAEALAPCARYDYRAFALNFKRDQFHSYDLARRAYQARGFGPRIGRTLRWVKYTLPRYEKSETTIATLFRIRELTNGRVRLGVRHRRHRLRRCAPVLR